jgi:hypothetical protein
MGKRTRAHRHLVEKPERKRSLGKPRSMWENNIKMKLQEIVSEMSIVSIWIRTGRGEGFL